jgi:hypothetical protein
MKGLALVGLLLFAISWFLPVHEGLDGLRDVDRELGQLSGGAAKSSLPGGPPGWTAFRLNWDNLWKSETWSQAKDDVRGLVWNLTSVTNLVMLGAAVAAIAGVRARSARAIGWGLIACLALNASWLYLSSDAGGGGGLGGLESFSVRDGLRIGYWLWLASFAVVGASLIAAKDETASAL